MSFNNIDDIIKESKTCWEHRDYETIEEPIIKEGVIKTHIVIQDLSSRIEHLKGNLIPNLQSLHKYNLMFSKENERITQELHEKKEELQELTILRNKIKNEQRNT